MKLGFNGLRFASKLALLYGLGVGDVAAGFVRFVARTILFAESLPPGG
jgi:hypothetical protein